LSLAGAEAMKYVYDQFNMTTNAYLKEMKEVLGSIGVNPAAIFEAVKKSAEGRDKNRDFPFRGKGHSRGQYLLQDTQAFLTWTRETLGLKLPHLETAFEINASSKRRQDSPDRQRGHHEKKGKGSGSPTLKLVVSK